jgi:hypothetical protein
MEGNEIIIFHGLMSDKSCWISSADTRLSVGGYLVTDVSGEIPVYVYMVAQRGRSFSDLWTFNIDEYFFLCYATV